MNILLYFFIHSSLSTGDKYSLKMVTTIKPSYTNWKKKFKIGTTSAKTLYTLFFYVCRGLKKRLAIDLTSSIYHKALLYTTNQLIREFESL